MPNNFRAENEIFVLVPDQAGDLINIEPWLIDVTKIVVVDEETTEADTGSPIYSVSIYAASIEKGYQRFSILYASEETCRRYVKALACYLQSPSEYNYLELWEVVEAYSEEQAQTKNQPQQGYLPLGLEEDS